MSKAKEYLENQGINPLEPIWWYGEDEILTLEDLMESYHQSRVSAITDEEIRIEMKSRKEYLFHEDFGFTDGVEWLKQKLTNKD